MRKKSLTRQIGVLFTDESYDKLIRLTDVAEVPLAKFIRQIVEAHLNSTNDQEETPNEPHD
jgi:predicted DNA-binding protein